ncbi:DUF4349 domain-containing protein [Cellulomonas sp. APG4]|uniref:DUF4349 domain-containing protein n=1 Tax=Cellulomonas sp. APG4 TaxID=1538656 RepID=UPI0013799634|nr:DUF4349 domain-containing protein [Cellulomonas sp. APG4]NCT91591.1 DUF4349 domain-containing protein [Cellulomonas sp. APG4]
MRTPRVLAVVLALTLVAGCSAAGSGDAADVAATSDGGGESAGMADMGAAEEGSDSAEAPRAESGLVPSVEDRQFVTEGSVGLTVESPRRAATAVAQLVERVGGHVQERVEQGTEDDEFASAHLVVRIPSTEVSGTLEQLGTLGTVEETSITSTEVTAQARDLDARIRALEISVARLEDLLSRATSTQAIVEAEQALTDRQAELESLESQRSRLADQVALSTLRIELWTEDTVPPEPPTGFWGGLVTGWNSLVATLTGLAVALGVLTPWLVVLGLVALVVLALRRRLRRTDRPGPAATAPSGPVPPPAPAAPAAAPTTTPSDTQTAADEPADSTAAESERAGARRES